MVKETSTILLLNLEKLYNQLKFEIYNLKFQNRELKKQIKILTNNKDETSESGSE